MAPWTTAATLAAPPDRVFDALVEQRRAVHTTADVHLAVDRPARRIVVQGRWWYRGTFTVAHHPAGSLVSYEIENVAPGWSWWLARLVQGPEQARRRHRDLAAILSAVGRHLQARSEPLP